MPSVSAKLRKTLKARIKSRSIYSIARETGIPYSSLWRFKEGEYKSLSTDNMVILAKYLGVPLDG